MSKEKISPELDGEIRSILGCDMKEIITISDGLIHQTYEIKTDKGEYIFQIADADKDKEKALERKVSVFSKAEESGLRVPELVTENVRVTKKNGERRKFYIVEKIPGKSLREKNSPELAYNAGRKLADIHNIQKYEDTDWLMPEENGFRIQQFEEGNLKNRILSKTKEDVLILKKNGFEEAGNKIQEIFKKYGENLPEEFRPVLCHNDYSPDNIITQNGKITGIIDFDYAYSGHNQRDLVKAANSFWLEGLNVREEFYEGYSRSGKLEDSFEENEPLYRLETLTRIIASIFELKDEVDSREKEEYSRKLNETIQYSSLKLQNN